MATVVRNGNGHRLRPWRGFEPDQLETFRADDGTVLVLRRWEARGPRHGDILVFHGAGAHGGLYEPFAAELATRGWSVWVPDLRGHGASGGRKGDVERFERYARDAAPLAERMAEPRFLWGESMGGLVALELALEQPGSWQGVVLSAPALLLVREMSRPVRLLGRVASRLVPRLTAPLLGRGEMPGLPPGTLGREFTVRWGMEVVRAGEALAARAPELRVPSLWLLPGADPLVDEERVAALARSVPGATIRLYPGYPHAILTGPEPVAVVASSTAWLEAQGREGSPAGAAGGVSPS
ncbi:MAG: alpha/beta fold hydrolase [Bacillota bacterium]|nr:alpha/beta fold hydrolase [Bacillota bacterium]